MRVRAGVLPLSRSALPATRGVCRMCRVKSIFSHTFYYRLFCKNVRNGYIYPAHLAQTDFQP